MKKIFAAFFLYLIFIATSQGQTHSLFAYQEAGKAYLLHSVVAKENWYSVGRIYNISPRDLAPFNGLTLEASLKIGQELKIPLTANNFSQNGKKDADETFVPVYHLVEANETMGSISAIYNRVPSVNLERWNRIKKDGIKEGMKLIVGYLKVKSSLSYLANEGVRNSDVAILSSSKPEPVQQKPDPVKPIKAEEKPLEKLPKAEPSNPPSNENAKPIFTRTNSTSNTNRFNGGYFAAEYNDGNNKLNGLAGTFKSTSGWNDGKYYVLINNVPVGTIIKVIAPATQKSVYAKVLGQLPDMKESEGLTIRISNAAASDLGEDEGKFNVVVMY
ncbi:MAG: LysM peptidoglycan-binding domain-containing protein [Bacteroidetes bacterium]|nr:LysM peptidoglycan-binding domain-containing protein [Bacteroidota bacterium]